MIGALAERVDEHKSLLTTRETSMKTMDKPIQIILRHWALGEEFMNVHFITKFYKSMTTMEDQLKTIEITKHSLKTMERKVLKIVTIIRTKWNRLRHDHTAHGIFWVN